MSVLLTASETPLITETLPAIKLIHANGTPTQGHIYAYLRMYACAGALCFNLTQFVRDPNEGCRMLLALGSAERDDYVLVQVQAEKDGTLTPYGADDTPTGAAQTVPLRHMAGEDEQGWYWAVEGKLTAEQCRTLLGKEPQPGSVFVGNVYSFTAQEDAYVCAFAVPAGSAAPARAGFSTFTVVPY